MKNVFNFFFLSLSFMFCLPVELKADSENKSFSIPATVYSKREISIVSEQSGLITYVHEVGSRFEKGQILVSINSDFEKTQLNSLKQQFRNQKEKLETQESILVRYNELDKLEHISDEVLFQKKIDIYNTKDQLSRIEQQINELEYVISKKNLVAPFDGVVTARSATPLEVTSNGAPLISIVDGEFAYVKARVSATKYPQLDLMNAKLAHENELIDLLFDYSVPRIDEATNTLELSYKISSRKLLVGQSVFIKFK